MADRRPSDRLVRAYRNLEDARERRRGNRVAVVRLVRELERSATAVRLTVVIVLCAFAAAALLRMSAMPEAPARALPPGLAP